MSQEHVHFVTGKLAEYSLRRVLEDLGPRAGFQFSVDVLGISVAALMTTDWIAGKLHVPSGASRVVVPGYCQGDLAPLATAAGLPVERGPKDLQELPDWFGLSQNLDDYGDYDIEIVAEINHCPRLSLDEIMAQAVRLAEDGADVIDLGCDPGSVWGGVGEAVSALRGRGLRVSIDSFQPHEIEDAVRAGAELVLSANSTNRDLAASWGCEVVAIPDEPATLGGLDGTIEALEAAGVRYRIDPVLEPIGFGFARSLGRYLQIRERYPDAAMMMGIGNLTELTDADSAAINVLLLGFCQELGIRSVLTTQVINWCRSSVRECDLARRLVRHAVQHRTLPKHVEPGLNLLRDTKVWSQGEEELDRLAASIRDPNYRLFAEEGLLHIINRDVHLAGSDAFLLFDELLAANSANLDPSHAFYLGYELCKAVTASTLGKQYRQDEELNWGFLTRAETKHRLGKIGPGKAADAAALDEPAGREPAGSQDD